MLFEHDKQRCIVRGAVPRFEDVELSELRDNARFGCSARRFEDCFGLGDGDVLVHVVNAKAKKAPNLSEGGARAILRDLTAWEQEAMRTSITAAPPETLAEEALIEAAAKRMIETTRKHWGVYGHRN
ncbi:hypothetical protein [Paraburkholderia kirstenboschensis]|uniref:Uncharacterized protein n=1 Tax=Paraburkholderia kirstenboschensis TaxID=1245436 RepID=A0ABZ0ET47_9BURK|nr:hypothetical protein [Paraburkholderia kirstenboschensis]WOD19799.1 hypothetical protein RW095_26685 [Paraburkholderia kirstenboschensis]